jgi:photosystem II stability/assembly factor-like uncharacterized protein
MNRILSVFLAVATLAFSATGLFAQRQPTVYVPVVSSELFIVGAPNPQTGLFLSRDDGISWEHTGWKNIRAFGVAVDPSSDGEIIYIASGNGVIKTEDGGDSWRVMTDWRITEVIDVRIDRVETQNVYIATAYGAFSSFDGGWTWTERNEGLLQTFLNVLSVDTENPEIIYAGGESGLYRSTDRAESWEHIGFAHMPVRAIAQGRTSPDVIFVGTEDDGIFRSNDRGRTWERLRNGLRHGTFYTLAVDPTNDAVLYAGGYETGIYTSTDGGNSWRRYTTGLTDLNVPAIAVHPIQNDIVFAGTNGGGLFRSVNGGRTWEQVGLYSAEIYSIIIE